MKELIWMREVVCCAADLCKAHEDLRLLAAEKAGGDLHCNLRTHEQIMTDIELTVRRLTAIVAEISQEREVEHDNN